MNVVEYKKNVLPMVPHWEDFIRALDYKFNNPHEDFIHGSKDEFVFKEDKCTDIFMYNKFDQQFWNVATFLNKKTFFQEIKNAEKYLFKEKKEWYAKALINFVGKEALYSAHKDPQDVISWQCIGSVEYRIYEDVPCNFGEPIDFRGLKYEKYILSPGDVIYIPTGIIHQAVIFEPRATIIFDIPVNKNEEK